ncbi:FAD:protein FMN transferase [Marinilactibacillus kalidii]|uniref:FAD:protein FMN transferase n=1 Tax=Marinilactibacillus kalidii TaxID=2820274 RepID=UPI003CC56987
MKKGYFQLLSLLFALSLIAGCGRNPSTDDRKLSSTPYEETEFLMGTVVKLSIYNDDKEDVLTTAFDRIEALAKFITTEESGEYSMISAINEAAGKQPVAVSDDLYKLIRTSVEYSEKTDGSFDLTIGPLTNLWRIGYPEARLPEQSEIDQALALVDYTKVELNDQEKSVFLKEPGMRLDLGAIAKGFITDEVVHVLKENGVDTAIIDLGGNLYVLGNSPRNIEEEWNVGIQDPFEDRGKILGSLPASNQSIVTSGIYERFLEVDGKQYPHLMNPETGYPFDNDLAGVSVVTEQSIDGDALSTSLFSKGLDDGLAFVNQLDGVDAIFVTKNKDVYLSEGLKDFELTNTDFNLKNGE